MFKGLSAPVSFHRYCSYCLLLIDNESLTHCQNIYCNKELTASNAAHFLMMNVSSQLQRLFNRPGFISDLKHCFTRKDLSKQGVIQDIYDGEQYKRLFPDGPLGDPGNISLLWNKMVHLSSIFPNFQSGLFTYQLMNYPIRKE